MALVGDVLRGEDDEVVFEFFCGEAVEREFLRGEVEKEFEGDRTAEAGESGAGMAKLRPSTFRLSSLVHGRPLIFESFRLGEAEGEEEEKVSSFESFDLFCLRSFFLSLSLSLSFSFSLSLSLSDVDLEKN